MKNIKLYGFLLLHFILTIDKELLNLKEKLKRDGFIVSGKGYDVESDEPTQTGRGIAVRIIENL